ncbi:calmodulin-A-like [Ostrea edulis]|uniref:calmodulin-A-like n=1 Tax=Ostrea edulis TaxID=37623 RepID=UPI0020959866|nr:calmodulin-A-like [Ostrea edulis]
MANHQHSEEQIEVWRESFDIFDKNKDGHISLHELDTVVRSLGLNPSMKNLRTFIKEIDQNQDGKIQFEDFKILMSKFYVSQSPEEQQKDIEGAFKIFDKDGNGMIEKSELLRVATTMGEPLTDEEAEQMIKIADTNNDGLINYKEFSRFITRPVLNSNTLGQ